MTDDMQRAMGLLAAEYSKIGNTFRAEDIRNGRVNSDEHLAINAIRAALRAAPEWQPIETAPEGRLVVVGWLDAEDSHYPENYEFDYLEDGLWAKHEDCVEHAHAVAPPGSKMPKEHPPYQWWMDLPAFPAALHAAPEGFVMVPVEATEEMIRAALPHHWPYLGDELKEHWRRMLAARPQGVGS